LIKFSLKLKTNYFIFISVHYFCFHKENNGCTVPVFHHFTDEEVKDVRANLVTWYEKNKRDLPWRRNATKSDLNERAYAGKILI
jgi:hypothetical protein